MTPPIDTSHRWIYAVKYSPRGDKFISDGEDKVICVWSMDGELLMQVEGHDNEVISLCWSKDGVHIFSGSYDDTIRKRRLIDGKELVVFQGHTSIVTSLYLPLDESHLVSASRDRSVRIWDLWDLKINQPVGDPLLHDDEIFAVVLSADGKYIASAGIDAKTYVWSLDAALKHVGADHGADASNAKPDPKLKGHPVRSRDGILHASQVSKQQPNNRLGGMSKYGKDFWDADTNPTPHPVAPPASTLSALHWRNVLGSLRFSPRPPNAPQSIPLESRRRNLNLFSGGSCIHIVEVAAVRKKNRSFVSLPSAAELARAETAAAMQRTDGNEAGSSTQAVQPQAMSRTEVSQGQTQGTCGGMGDVSYEVSCCGFFFGRRRLTSHESY